MTTIYFADLTHLTITLSNDSFPLNVGLVAAYAQKKHPDVDVHIFKYPESLKAALDESTPDILALSHYPWNSSINRSFLKYAKSLNANVLTVMGGPNISYDERDQERFLTRLDGVLDFYVMYEGESGFDVLLNAGKESGFDLVTMKEKDIPGSIYMQGGAFHPLIPIGRNRQPDEFPSPYLNGLMDQFFDDRLSPLIETHRGCPFQCTYCHEGHESYRHVNQFATERVKDEIEYIANRIGPVVKNLMIADPNFGMYDRDIELARSIAGCRKKHGYPATVFATTAKNRKEKLIAINQELTDVAMPIWMSVQSMNDETLDNVKRKNIRLEDMVAVQGALTGQAATSKSELIIPMPGETLASHKAALIKLMEMNISSVVCYQLMLVEGSEIKTDKVKRAEYKIETHFRVLPRSFTKMDGLDDSLEVEEIAVGTRDFSFEDYCEARQLHLIISSCYNGGAFSGFFRFLRERNELSYGFLDELWLALMNNQAYCQLVEKFMEDTTRELFKTEEAIRGYYGSDENFQKLVSGEDGANLIQKYTSLALIRYHGAIIDAFEDVCGGIVRHEPAAIVTLHELADYHRLLFKNFLDDDRESIENTNIFQHDFGAWLMSDTPLTQHQSEFPLEITFYTTHEQYETLESYFERYGRGDQALGKILTRLSVVDLLRIQKQKVNA